MAGKGLSVFLFGALKTIPAFAKTHFLVWVDPQSLAAAHRQKTDRRSVAQLEPLSGMAFLIANLVLVSIVDRLVIGETPPFELPPVLAPIAGFLNALPVLTIAEFAAVTALGLLVPFCFLKIAGRTVTMVMLFRILCYASALVTGAGIVFFYLPVLLLPQEAVANMRGYVIWPISAVGLFTYYWIARQVKHEGGNGGAAIYLGTFAATALLTALQATPLWPRETFDNNSGSMLPTLQAGDYVLANKWAYLWRQPMRGEIAVFRGPTDPHVRYLKRVIGMPGDRIQFSQSILHINDVPVERTRLTDSVINPGTTISRRMRHYAESLPWETKPDTNTLRRPNYRILEISDDNGALDNTPVYTVPDNHYFVVGDNRDQSLDSRVAQFGFVPESHFIAPIFRRLLPPTALDIPTSIE